MYFIFYTGFGIYLPFINIYYRDIGLSGLEIGLINTLSPLVGMLSAPLWGVLNDRYGKTRVQLAIAVLGSILAGWGIACELFPAGHFLRWLLPLSVALIPALADIMTAVNNDAAAIEVGTFFIWGSLPLLRRGF